MNRRQFLAAAGALGVGLAVRPDATSAQDSTTVDLGDGFQVQPRSAWAGDLAPVGALTPEEPRFLLVHHTVNPNDYAEADVPALLQGVYGLHTGPEKGWPDVAYNFFVDRYGGVWEGRAGSSAGPVRGDATGGNQGYSQLCCFIGDHSTEPPTPEAQAAMTHLLAHLGERYQIDTAPGATVSFTSLGSNRWPAGATVDAATISGHRDMSQTACPGDAAYPLVREVFPDQVTAIRVGRAAATATTSTTAASGSTSTLVSAPPTNAPEDAAGPTRGADQESPWLVRAVVGAGAVGVAALAALGLRMRRTSDDS